MIGTQATTSARQREASSHMFNPVCQAWTVFPPQHDGRHTEQEKGHDMLT
jgi:hypothetical protein